MAPAPPGNLHGLSPRHAAGRHLEATQELKREKPWSYLRVSYSWTSLHRGAVTGDGALH